MGKSNKKSAVEVAPASVTVPPSKPPSKSFKKEKRDEVVLEKPISAKMQKKEIAEVQTKSKVDKKPKKIPPLKKKIETSSSEDTSSDSEEEDDSAKVSTARKCVPVPIKRAVLTTTPKKKDASSYSSENYSDSSENYSDSSENYSDSDDSDDEDDSAKVSTARKSVPVPIKRAVLTTTPKKKDASSDNSESYSESDDEIPAAKKFRHAEEISSEHVEIVSDDEGPQKIDLSAPSESSLTAPAPKRLCKGKKQVMSSYATKLVEASPTIMQRVATPAIPPCVYLLAEAIRELEKHPEIFEDAELYDFATVCFLTTTNRVTFLSIRADRRVAWLKNRYMSSLH